MYVVTLSLSGLFSDVCCGDASKALRQKRADTKWRIDKSAPYKTAHDSCAQ